MGGRRGLVLLAIAGACAPASARADDLELDRVSRYTPVERFGETVVWSHARSDGRYALTVFHGGRVRTLPVATRRVPFDADLGPDRDGRTVAVYSRCREEDLTTRTPRGCRIHLFDFASGRERRVRGTSRARRSEIHPSIWRGKVAFARYRDPARREHAVTSRIFVRDARGRGWNVAGGSPSGASVADRDAGAGDMDLRGRTLLFSWGFTADRCVTERDPSNTSDLPSASEIWVATPGSGSRRLAQGCSDDATAVFAPSVTAHGLEFNAAAGEAAERVSTDRAGVERARRLLEPGTGDVSSSDGSAGVVRTPAGYAVVLDGP